MRFIIRLAVSLSAVALLGFATRDLQAQANPVFRCTVFALNHGEARLMEPPGGTKFLIGAGAPNEGPLLLQRLQKRGIKSIDTLVAQSWKADQIGGALAILKGMPVRQFLYNPLYVKGKYADALYAAVEDRERPGKFAKRVPSPGEEFTVFYSPPCQVAVVGPTGPMLASFAKDSECSMTMEYRYDRLSILDLGTTSQVHQKAMWQTAPERPSGEVLLFGRSGARDALMPSLLKSLKTRVAVISVPRKSARKPAAETLAALRAAQVRVYRTDQSGDVTVTTDGHQIKVATDR